MKIIFRFPYDFYGYGNSYFQALRLWVFHIWYDYNNGIYKTAGIRIFGIECSIRKYKFFDY